MSSELRPIGQAEHLTAIAIAGWAAGLPADARVTSLTTTRGDQRDSWSAFNGLRASWTEDRPDLPGATATYGSVVR